MPDPLSALQTAIGHRFQAPELLELALRHRSTGSHNNERLEFLGDGLLNFVVAHTLFETKPDVPEGDLSRLRASLVRESTLARIAQGLSLGDLIELGQGERASGGHRRASIRADALEAVIGAVYLDAGFDAAATVVRTLWAGELAGLPDAESLKDSKTRLQEWLQARALDLPSYAVVSESGPVHKRHFVADCRCADARCQGEGSSRRKAEQNAAAACLAQLQAAEATHG